MDKLIKLLREFDDENWNVVHIENYIYAQDYMIISKRFGFIKRLVDNDKIDMEKVKEGEIMISCGDVDNTIIKLAISDTPIEDLISYLK